MNKRDLILILGISTSVLLSGCSTPMEVKELAQKTRAATDHMGETHQQDLRTLAAYDRSRIAQFNQLLNNYFSLRQQVLNAFNEALDKSKESAIAELDHSFDQRAEQLMTVQFWSGFREEADKDLNNFLLNSKEKAVAEKNQADSYGRDPESRNQSLLAARQLYLNTALKYETVESSFAELIRKINSARDEYHAANQKLFAQIQPLSLPALPDQVKNFTLSNNTAEITQRIADLQQAYAQIDQAQAVTQRYLDENNPAADFFVSVGKAVLGVSSASNMTTNSPVSATPADPSTSQLPGLDALFGSLIGKINQVDVQKSAGANTLDQIINQVINRSQPLIRASASTSSPLIAAPPATQPEP